jgi:hypothetical protein
MRRKQPANFRECIVKFLSEVAGAYTTGTCELRPPSVSEINDDARAFIEAYNTEVRMFPDPYLPTITQAEFDTCLDWVVTYPTRIRFQSIDFLLSRSYYISSWRFAKKGKVVLNSELVEDYGTMQMLGTRFEFETVEEYRWVKAAVKRIFDLELNDKHAPRKEPSSESFARERRLKNAESMELMRFESLSVLLFERNPLRTACQFRLTALDARERDWSIQPRRPDFRFTRSIGGCYRLCGRLNCVFVGVQKGCQSTILLMKTGFYRYGSDLPAPSVSHRPISL